jgi:hypothetical protein
MLCYAAGFFGKFLLYASHAPWYNMKEKAADSWEACLMAGEFARWGVKSTKNAVGFW